MNYSLYNKLSAPDVMYHKEKHAHDNEWQVRHILEESYQGPFEGITLVYGSRCRETCQDNWYLSHDSNWKLPDYKKDVITQKHEIEMNEK
jgi:hypothetical protein